MSDVLTSHFMSHHLSILLNFRRITALSLGMICGCSCAVLGQTSNWEDYINQGIQAAHGKDDTACLKAFQSALDEAIRSNNTRQIQSSLDNVAWAYMQLHDYDRAVRTYKQLVEMTNFEGNAAVLNLASVYRLTGNFAQAEPLYARLMTRHYLDSETMHDYVSVLRQLGRTVEANQVKTEQRWLKEHRPVAGSAWQFQDAVN